MVFYSTLNRLYSLIQNENLRSMKRWPNRHRKDKEGRPSKVIKKLKSKIREILNIISGNDIVEMLKGQRLVYIFYK
jgi:hypothetical protein